LEKEAGLCITMLSLCLSAWLFLNKWAHINVNRRGTLSLRDIPEPHFYYNNKICFYKVIQVSTLKGRHQARVYSYIK